MFISYFYKDYGCVIYYIKIVYIISKMKPDDQYNNSQQVYNVIEFTTRI